MKNNLRQIPRDKKTKSSDSLKQYVLPPIRIALLFIFLSIFIFGIWGSLAPLDSAVISRGVVIVSGNSKAIQHYEGGIIEQIFVQDGQFVKREQPLLELNNSSSRAAAESLLVQLRSLAATERRLLAEIEQNDEVDFNVKALSDDDESTKIIINNQRQLFKSRMGEFTENIRSYEEENKKLRIRMQGLEKQQLFMQDSAKINRERVTDIDSLHNKGVISKHAMMQVRKEYQDMQGRLSQLEAEVIAIKQEIIKNAAAKAAYKNRYYSSLAHDYERNHIELINMRSKYNHNMYILNRTVIKAPIDGVVTDIKHHTIGGVVRPSEVIMQVVPQESDLIIEAKVSPNEINNIHVGTKAKVSLDSYKQRIVPRVAAEVTYVSADRILAERMVPGSLPEYYLIRLKISAKAIESINADIKLTPGMPVTAFLVRGSRTFMEYILSPLTESFHKAMKEQ